MIFILSKFGQHKNSFAITGYHFIVKHFKFSKNSKIDCLAKPNNITLLGIIWVLVSLSVRSIGCLDIAHILFLALGNLPFRASASKQILTELGKIGWCFRMNQATVSISICRFTSIAIHVKDQTVDRLIFNMDISYLEKTAFILRRNPERDNPCRHTHTIQSLGHCCTAFF